MGELIISSNCKTPRHYRRCRHLPRSLDRVSGWYLDSPPQFPHHTEKHLRTRVKTTITPRLCRTRPPTFLLRTRNPQRHRKWVLIPATTKGPPNMKQALLTVRTPPAQRRSSYKRTSMNLTGRSHGIEGFRGWRGLSSRSPLLASSQSCSQSLEPWASSQVAGLDPTITLPTITNSDS